MSYTIGDGMVAIATAAGIVGYVYVIQRSRQQRLEVIHQERMAAMEKGIPLPEFPWDPVPARREPDPTVLPILGLVLSTLSIGTMIALYVNRPVLSNGFWVAPLPLAFMGFGLIAFHFLKGEHGR